jgi:acetyltransferase-like isoleucine patch superfamily enzyme
MKTVFRKLFKRIIFGKYVSVEIASIKYSFSLAGWMHQYLTGRGHYPRMFRKRNVGQNSYVDPTVQIFGWLNVRIGRNSTLSEDSWLNVNDPQGNINRISIGNNCHIGRRNYFSTATQIRVKDYAFTGLDCHFLGCAHDTSSPMNPYVTSGITKGAPIEIGTNCWLSTSVTVLQGVTIGYGSVIGARSVVSHDIPPFSVAIGNPCAVIKRYDFKSKVWIKVADWLDEYNQFIPSEAVYLEALKMSAESVPLPLIASSKRFGWM